MSNSTFPLSDLVRSILFLFAILSFLVTANAGTIEVPPGGNIQAAIDAAQLGDTIVLQAGATYETPGDFTPYMLVNKSGGSGYITITSSSPPPPDGTRVTLAHRANMPKLVVKKGSSFFEALHGAHHYRLSGLWFTNKQGGTTTLLLGNNGEDIKHPDPRDPQVDWPHDIIIDHCFFNPVEWDMYPEANLCSSVNTAIGLVGINVTIRDSVMKGFGAKYGSGVGANLPSCGTELLDGESVIIGTAPGPMLIDNNQMEEWFVAFFIGGSDPGSMYGSQVLSSPTPTLTSATLSNVTGLNVGDNIAFEMNVASPTFGGITVAAGTITSINGNNVTFTHLVGKWGPSNSFIRIPDGAARPKTIGDPGGAPPCTPNRLGTPTWCSQAYWGGYNPSNITITHNYINKPQRWYNFAGTDGKGFFEIKLCDTCLIDGNVFEGKTGFTVTVRNQGGRAPWSAIRNLTISNNLATQFSAGLYGLFSDNEQLSTESSNIVFHNNLMYGEFDDSAHSGFLPLIFSGSHGNNVQFTHNTILQSGRIMAYGNSPAQAGIGELTNFVFKDNIVNWGTGSQSGYGCFDGALEVCTPNYVWTRNAMIGAPTGPIYETQTLASFPSGNWNPANLSAVGFTDPASRNYRLLSSSPYYRAASDGKDVGVDMDQLLAHLNGSIPVPTPTPTPIPTPTPTPIPSPTPTPTPTPTPSLASVLVTAPTGTPLHGVSNGTTINLSELPTRSLTISIVPAMPVGSVKVQYNGEESVENVLPYSLAGDTDGEFNPANLSVGIHTLTVTPFSQPNLGGSSGTPVTITFAVVDNPNGTPPILLTEQNSDRAVALNAATFIVEPFALLTQENFGSDKRTRVQLFVSNFQSSSDGSDTIIYAENSGLGSVLLPIEHVGRVPGFDWLSQITVVLPDRLANAGDVWVRVVLRGLSSNQARISISESARLNLPWTKIRPLKPSLRLRLANRND